jgi:tetratricopeptide (TPR) repeat protein
MNVGGVFGLLVVLLSTIAHAQPAPSSNPKREAASRYVDDGLAAQERGDHDTAITLYTKAYELVPHPVLLFNIAQAHRLAGRIEQADIFYQRFLATNPTGKEAQIAREVLAEIGEARRAQPPRLEPPRADPTPRSVETSGDDQRKDSHSPPSPPMTSVSAAGLDSRRAPPWYTDKVGDALVIGGVAATVVAVVVYRSALSDIDAAKSADSYSQSIDLKERTQDKNAVFVGFAVAGGSLVVAGILRYVVHDRTTDPPSMDVARTHGGGMVTYRTTF